MQQVGFIARVPELDREAHGARLRRWASESCVDFCFLKGEGFMGVLRHPTTRKKFQQLLVNNLKNWHKKGELPDYVPRATYERGWVEVLTVDEYAERAKKTRAYSEKVVGQVLADVLRTVHVHIDAKLLRAKQASEKRAREEKQEKREPAKHARLLWELADCLEMEEREQPARFAARTAPDGDVDLTPALRAAIDKHAAKRRRVE
jgi:hypothetical protein